MFRFIQQIFFWLRGGSLKLLVLAGIILLVWGTLSPIGTLVWWAEEGASILGWRKNRPQGLPSSGSNTAKSSQLNCYIVYLSGVGDFSANQLTTGEEIFLKRLVQTHPNCVAVSDVFPYSVANESLGAPERLLSPLWSFADQAQGWLGITNVIIKIRNLWRFAISVDPRYGPVYNQGIAIAIMQRMQAMHPIAQSNQRLKIILIGTSGGVQVALGAANFLDEWLDPQITVISIGGVFSGKNGFNVTDHVYHLWGRQDWVDDIGSIVFPSRWVWTVGSPFNQARRQNLYTAKMSGSHAHDGTEGYFGTGIATKNGTTYVELTLQEVNQLPVWSKKNN